MRSNGSTDKAPIRIALSGTLPIPVISSRSASGVAVTVEFYRSRDTDVVTQCSQHARSTPRDVESTF
jgi:hypothetical protein